MTTITNDWITINALKNGVPVQRKFAGLDTEISHENNEVVKCEVKYWQRELYPDGSVIKTELKWYTLRDLPETVNEEYRMEPLAVLSGFIASIGQAGIVDPSRDTLENSVILPFDAENGYPLRRDTREKIYFE